MRLSQRTKNNKIKNDKINGIKSKHRFPYICCDKRPLKLGVPNLSPEPRQLTEIDEDGPESLESKSQGLYQPAPLPETGKHPDSCDNYGKLNHHYHDRL